MPRTVNSFPDRVATILRPIQTGSEAAGRVSRALIALLATCVIAHSAWFTWQYFQPAPWLDMWDEMPMLRRAMAGDLGFGDMIAEHNDHRIATARLFFIADAMLFRFTGRFTVTADFLLYAALGLLLGWLWRRDATAGRLPRLPLAVFVAATLSVCAWDDLVTPFQIQFSLLCLSAVASAALLARATGTASSRKSVAFGLAGAAAYGAAMFSMAAGVLLLPGLVLLLAVRRARPALWAAMLLPAAALLALFLNGYDWFSFRAWPFALTWGAVIGLMRSVIAVTAGFVGNPFAGLDTGLAFALGAAGLAGFALVLWRKIRPPRAGRVSSETEAAFMAVVLWVVLNAVAAGRLRSGFDGLSGGFASRYTPLGLLFWVCLGGLALQRSAPANLSKPLQRTEVLAPALAAALLLAANMPPGFAGQAGNFRQALAIAGTTLRAGVYAPTLIGILNPSDLGQVSDGLRFARIHALGPFTGSNRPPHAVRAMLTRVAGENLPACVGEVDDFYRLDASRAVIRGWLASADRRRSAAWVEVRDAAGQAAAVLPSQERRGFVPLAPGHGFAMGFNGALGHGLAAGEVKLTGVFANGTACRLVVPGPGPLRVSWHLPTPDATLPGNWGGGEAAQLSGPWAGAVERAARANNPVQSVVPAPAAGEALRIAFAAGPRIEDQAFVLRFTDGATLHMRAPDDVSPSKWLSLAVPPALLAAHPGPVTIIGEAGVDNWLALGPVGAGPLDPDEARLP